MLTKKEQLFQEYFETTELAVTSMDPEEVASLVEYRDKLISQINEIDLHSGKSEINENIKEMIKNSLVLEGRLENKLEQLKEEARVQLQSLKNAQKLKNQYEPTYAITDGAFYDKRK